jgi:hypothetical protein
MHLRHHRASRRRRGKTLVAGLIMLPVVLGGASLSVDLGVVTVAKTQLHTVTDSGALAGARMLADEYRVRGTTDLTTHIANAQDRAAAVGGSNGVLGDSPVFQPNVSNSDIGDIVVGYLDTTDPNAPLRTGAVYRSLFNSVQVHASRTSDHGGKVPAFFSAALGYDGTNVGVTSTATALNHSIVGLRQVSTVTAPLLPIALDVDTYGAMLARTTTDQYTYNPVTKEVTSGPDGITESQLYPVKDGSPGNWGTVKIGVDINSTATLGAQIRYGVTSAQLANYPGGMIQLDATKNPPSVDLEGNPGISAGIKDDLAAIIGEPRIIPIYSQLSGNGNNAVYTIVKLAGVRVLDVNFQGNPKYVIIQPALVQTPAAIPGPVQSWTKGGLLRLRLTR